MREKEHKENMFNLVQFIQSFNLYQFQNYILIFLLLVNYSSQLQYANQKLPLKSYQELNYADFKFELIDTTFKIAQKKPKRQIINGIDSPILETNRLRFNAFGRNFEIYLKRDIDLIADKIDIEVRYSSSSSQSFKHIDDFFSSNYYSGFVEGESRSHVICYFEKSNLSSNNSNSNATPSAYLDSVPLIYAQIQIQNDENENIIYYIEPLIDLNNQHIENASKYLIYRTSDIDSNVVSNDVFNQTVCRPKYFNDLVKSSADSFKNSSYFSEIKNEQNRRVRQASFKKRKGNDKENRVKKNRCYLALVADHRFFKEIANSNVKLTTAYLINIVGAINTIFTRTSWNLDDQLEDSQSLNTNYGFSVEKVIVHAEASNGSSNHYNHKDSSKDADKILEAFGEEDWSAYCLAHLFTYQSFENSVLGLAYVSSPLSYTLGGICSMTARSRRSMSVNTGLSSYKSSSITQGRLLQREAELVTAHELGHNWGSEHDPFKPECSPSSSNGGNFIMYAYSNQGHEKNNYYFSPCTINSISEVLKTKAECFKGESLSYCGNDRVEIDEECDAGLNGRQGLDKCCDSNCRLKSGAVCSDSNHYCCNDCQFAPKGRRCYSSSNYIECFNDHSFCTGTSKDCPSQAPKDTGTSCTSYDKGKCNQNGQCLSLCQQQEISSFPCKCSNEEQKCMICCRNVINVNQTGDCKPIQQHFPNVYLNAVYLSNGRSCVDGLCENKVCRQKVKDYVGRLWKVIQTVTVSGFVEFMKRNIVGSIIIISLSFWVPISCCVHFCIDKRNKQMQKQQIYDMRAQRLISQHKSDDSSKQSYMKIPFEEKASNSLRDSSL